MLCFEVTLVMETKTNSAHAQKNNFKGLFEKIHISNYYWKCIIRKAYAYF